MSRLGRFVRRKWVKRISRVLIVLILLTIVGTLITGSVIRSQGRQRLAEQVAALDAADPRWRWADLDADRPDVPDAENSAQLIPQLATALEGRPLRTRAADDENPFRNEPPNRRMTPKRVSVVREALAENAAAVEVARQFRIYPRGRNALVIDYVHPEQGLPHLVPCQSAAVLLELDAESQLLNGRPAEAVARIRSLIHLARLLEAEPLPGSQDVRRQALDAAARVLERSLAASELRGELVGLRADCLRESQINGYFLGQRGYRAVMHGLFERVESGEISVTDEFGTFLCRRNLRDRLRSWAVVGAYLQHNHANFLKELTALCSAGSLPDWQARAAIQQQRTALRNESISRGLDRDVFSFSVVLAWGDGHTASLRTKARLRCAAVALALERFRLEHGRWPAALSELPADRLPEVPIDPFDGKPLRYVRGNEGVTVYSVGADETDNSGRFDAETGWYEPGQDVVFRLYNPDQRGLPALAAPRKPEGRPDRGPRLPPDIDD